MSQQISLVARYLSELRERLLPSQRQQFDRVCGATPEALRALHQRFPACPSSLLDLLAQVNGTWWQAYGEHTVGVLMLGSDVFEYPYYLMSVEQILTTLDGPEQHAIAQIYRDFPEYCVVDPRIDAELANAKRLCFAQCMNNGGTSVLSLDFNPAAGGNVGQVIRFLHDPDSYRVIAPSFDVYLQNLIDEDFAFLTEDCE